MITRQRTVEDELADLLASVRARNPWLTTVYVVAVEPSDPRFQKWFVGAYATQELALARAFEEHQSFAACPPGWVDTTVHEIELGYVVELPMSTERPPVLQFATPEVCDAGN